VLPANECVYRAKPHWTQPQFCPTEHSSTLLIADCRLPSYRVSPWKTLWWRSASEL